MYMSIFQSLIPKSKKLTTYQIGLLVARTNKILRERTNEVLFKHDITSVDWVILGLLQDNRSSGLRLFDLSIALGVEASFTTVRIDRLSKRGLVKTEKNRQDKRERFAIISPTGSQLVCSTEPVLRAASRTWLRGVKAVDVLGFTRVMQQAVKNYDGD